MLLGEGTGALRGPLYRALLPASIDGWQWSDVISRIHQDLLDRFDATAGRTPHEFALDTIRDNPHDPGNPLEWRTHQFICECTAP